MSQGFEEIVWCDRSFHFFPGMMMRLLPLFQPTVSQVCFAFVSCDDSCFLHFCGAVCYRFCQTSVFEFCIHFYEMFVRRFWSFIFYVFTYNLCISRPSQDFLLIILTLPFLLNFILHSSCYAKASPQWKLLGRSGEGEESVILGLWILLCWSLKSHVKSSSLKGELNQRGIKGSVNTNGIKEKYTHSSFTLNFSSC